MVTLVLSVLVLLLGLAGLQLLGVVIDVIRHALDPGRWARRRIRSGLAVCRRGKRR